MEAIAIGDLHFDGGFAKVVDLGPEVITKELNGPCKWATKRGIRNVILLGDICDGPRMSYESQLAFVDFLRKWKNLRFWAILGNHDMYSPDPRAGHSLQLVNRMYEGGNFKLFEEPEDVEIDGAPVRFLPWPHRKFHKRMLNIAHTEIYGAKSDSGRPFEKDGLSDSNAVCVIGHLHTKQVVRNTYYPGPLYQTQFGLSKDRWFAHIKFDSHKDYNIEFIPHRPSYLLETIVVSSRKDLKKIPDDPNVLVKLVVNDGADLNPEAWATKMNVVKVTPFKSKEELAEVLQEDLSAGTSLRVDTTQFVETWIDQNTPSEDLAQTAKTFRKKLITKKERT